MNEDPTTFSMYTKLEETVNKFTEQSKDSQKFIRLELWVEINTRLKENLDLAGIHMKKTWIF